MTNTGPTVIIGNLGLNPGTSVTGFPPGAVTGGAIHINDMLAIQGQASAAIAYGQLAGQAFDTNLTGQDLGGLTLLPGVYRFDTAAQLNGTLTLDTGGDPNAAFHFQIGTDVTTGTNSAIVLMGLNGAVNQNVFWQVGSSATLGTATSFYGSLLAFTSITLNTGVTLDYGRVLALNGAVTLDSNSINSTLLPNALGSIWSGDASNLWSGGNWSPDFTGAVSSALTPNADVIFSVTGVPPQNQNTIVDVPTTISSLTVNDPAAVTISGTNLLSITGGGVNTGITTNNGAGLVTINTDLQLSGPAQAMTVNNAAGLVINGVVGGGVGLTKAGTGTLTLAGANAYTGATTIQQGVLQAAAANVVPAASAVVMNAGANFNLANNAQSVGSLAGAAGAQINLGSAPLIIGNDNTSTLYAGTIIGTGGVTKVGTGTQSFGGANAYTGATTIQQGVLQAAAANVVPAASAVVMNAGATFNLANNAQSVGSLAGATGAQITLGSAPLIIGNDNTSTLYAGTIIGSGGVTKVGTGTQSFGGANAYTGATEVTGGTLQAAAANVISNQSAVAVQAGAEFNLAGFDQHIGSLEGAGGVDLGGASLVTGSNQQSTEYAGSIGGSGSVEKVGAGTFILSGNNTFAGQTKLSQGTLVVNGSLAGNALVAGGTLRGTGTIGGSVFNRATIVPGTSGGVGKLTIGGNFTQAPSGSLGIRLGSPSSYDRLAIGGSAQLNGGLQVSFLNGFQAQPGDTFRILTAGGGVSGTFSNVSGIPETGTLLSLGVVYESNAVVLQFMQGSFAGLVPDPEGNPNAFAVAQALDDLAAQDANNSLIQELNTQSLSDVAKSFSLLSGEDLAAMFSAGLSLSQVQTGNLERRLSEVRRSSQGGGGSQDGATDTHGGRSYGGKETVDHDGKNAVHADGKTAKEVAATEEFDSPRWGFYISGTGEWGDVETTSQGRGSSFTTAGVTVGADYRINPHFVLGAAIGYANTSSDLSGGGKLSIDTGKLNLYGTYHTGGFYVNGILGAGYGSYDTKRRTVGGFARGDTEGVDFNGLIGTGYDFQFGRFTVGPTASLQYSTLSLDGFTERGAVGALRVEAQSQDSLMSAVGLRATFTQKVGKTILTPEIRAQWLHEYLDNQSTIDAGFSRGRSYSVKGPEIGRDGLLLDVGVSAQFTPTVGAFAFYTGIFGRENYTVHGVNAGVRISF